MVGEIFIRLRLSYRKLIQHKMVHLTHDHLLGGEDSADPCDGIIGVETSIFFWQMLCFTHLSSCVHLSTLYLMQQLN